MRTAEQYKAKTVYQLQFMRKEDGRLSCYPAVVLDIPENVSEDEQRKILESAIKAPAGLGPHDKVQIGEE